MRSVPCEVPNDQLPGERSSVRELDEKRFNDGPIKTKICAFCKEPTSVDFSKRAIDDMGLVPVEKKAVLEALHEHSANSYRMSVDRMENGDLAYIADSCSVEGTVLYVKVKFYFRDAIERMLVFSAHPPSKW